MVSDQCLGQAPSPTYIDSDAEATVFLVACRLSGFPVHIFDVARNMCEPHQVKSEENNGTNRYWDGEPYPEIPKVRLSSQKWLILV